MELEKYLKRDKTLNEIAGSDVIHKFLGNVNKSMDNLLNAIEDTNERNYSYPDKSQPKGLVEKKYKAAVAKIESIDKAWKALSGDIQTVIRML